MSVIALLLMALLAFTAPTPPAASSAATAIVPARSAAQRHVVQHLDGALRVLERRDLRGLSVEQRERRATALAELKAYRDAGRYPINRDYAGERVPYFIDPVTDVHCAVGHLMAQTGYGALARRIAAADNHVRVLELRDDAEVRAWLDLHGFTLEEAARIQPSYEGGGGGIIPPPGGVLPIEPVEDPVTNGSALVTAMGVSGALFITQTFTTLGKGGRLLPTANLVLGLATTALGVASNESTGLRVATSAVGLISAISGLSALQGGGAAAPARRVQWRIAPSVGRRAVYAGATWRF